jgi:hypothetical protein
MGRIVEYMHLSELGYLSLSALQYIYERYFSLAIHFSQLNNPPLLANHLYQVNYRSL